MAKVYFGLGTNLGNKKENLHTAVGKIEERIGKVISLSALYETAPWGFVSSHSFLNAAAYVETDSPPEELLKQTQTIEKEVGRTNKSVGGKYADRLIDVDLLLYDDLVFHSRKLVLPHPLIEKRLFVMEPLAEIAPKLIHPIHGKSMEDLLKQLLVCS